MNFTTALRLGRVSNLPTVWTNVIAAATLSRSYADPVLLGLAALACSLFYVAGMFLNDYYDREFDAVHQPDRPIPSGQADAFEVAVFGYTLLAAAALLLGFCALLAEVALAPAAGAAVALAAVIVAYDRNHKTRPGAPLLMAACRALVYVCAAAALGGTWGSGLAAGASAMACYIIGLSYAARLEQGLTTRSAWPLAVLAVPPVALCISVAAGDAAASALGFTAALAVACAYALARLLRGEIGGAIAVLIAGIALLDAALIAAAGSMPGAAAAALAFPLTLGLQRAVRGT